jgi:hypothetical protein
VLFNGHAGAHSWSLADSNGDTVRARLDLVPPQPVAGAGVEATPVQPPLPKPCRHPRTENISERSTAPAASGSCTSDTYPRGSTGSIVPPRGTGERGSLVVLPFPGPVPVGVLGTGVPGEGYPFPWSVRGWIDGENAAPERIADMGRFAAGVGEFLTALQRCDTDGGPRKGLVDVNMGVVEAVVAEHRERG